MKTSITKRLFLYIILVVVFFSTLILLSNTLLLKPLYYKSIQNTMLRALDSLESIDYSLDTDVWLEEMSSLTAGNSYDIVIRNEEEVLYSTSSEVGLMPRPNPIRDDLETDDMQTPRQDGVQEFVQNNQFILRRNISDLEQIDDNTYLGTAKVPKSNIEMMVCIRELSDETTIFLTQPIEPINQSIQQANTLLIACAVLSMAISAVFVFNISKRFTKPIKQIQNTVGELAVLNFGKKCDIKTGDELQSLGDDVNKLADELQNALNTLQRQNEQLEKDIVAQRQFISNASHELRTPLSLIKGYADEMHMGYAKDASQKDAYIEIIAEEATKMNRLFKEMIS